VHVVMLRTGKRPIRGSGGAAIHMEFFTVFGTNGLLTMGFQLCKEVL
jgi:hypothetical protein